MNNIVKRLENKIARTDSKLRSGSDEPRPFDSQPPGYDRSKDYHIEAWQLTIPNFIHNGQLFSKARFTKGYHAGRACVGLLEGPGERKLFGTGPRTIRPVKWLKTAEIPPEEETADSFEWTPDLIAEWRNLVRKLSNRPVWYQPPRRHPAAGYLEV